MNTKKSKCLFFILCVLGFIAMTLMSCSKEEPKLIPRKILFGNPVKTDPLISPDGKKLSDVILNPETSG